MINWIVGLGFLGVCIYGNIKYGNKGNQDKKINNLVSVIVILGGLVVLVALVR